MKKMNGVVTSCLVFALSLFLTASPALAGGKGHGRANPHGWDKGQKKGWHSDVPPGLEKKRSESVEEAATEQAPGVEPEAETLEQGAGRVTGESEESEQTLKENATEKARERIRQHERHKKGHPGKKER
ncbi:MAG: hypothetical protein JRI36_08980 [Deltaproteobacteria bacterium]|nr:hypothetical protein [Deltaproteobacteria bacterium]